MASSEIKSESYSTMESEPAQDSGALTIDNIFSASENGDLEKLRKFVEQDGASFSLPQDEGYYALHMAAINNRSQIVEYIIEHGGDVNAVNNDQWTALHFSAEIGSISVADVLLQNKAHVEAADVDGNRAVHIAALCGQTSFFNHIVAKYNADFEAPNNDGERPLHCAAANNHPEIVQYIIEHGGDVNAIDKDQSTALHFSADSGSVDVADLLLLNEAQVEAVDVVGNTAVHFAVRNEQASFLKHIVARYNADFEVANNDGVRPLHCAVRRNNLEIVQYIIEHGGDVNAMDNDRCAALHFVAVSGSISIAEVLLKNGAQVEFVNGHGNRVEHIAARNGQASFLKHIVAKYNGDFEVSNNLGVRPLHMAAESNKVEVVQYIIEHGGDVNAVDNDQSAALHFAAYSGSISVADVLLQNGAQVEVVNADGNNAIHIAALKGQISFLNHIVAHYNADFDVPNNAGVRPLHLAAKQNHHEIVQYIIEHDGDVNAVDNYQQTALHFSAENGSISTADLLLQYGVQVEAADVNGNRAVHIAAHKGKTSFLNHIVTKYNADFDVPNNDGMTPLHCAAANNHLKSVQYIVEHGGDVNAVNISQQTALHLSANIGSISIADVLLQNGAHVEATCLEGNRAVHVAALKGHTSFLKHIVAKYNADFEAPVIYGGMPLHCAVEKNNLEIVQYIIEHGGDVNVVNTIQQTALHISADRGSISIADVLLQNGAHVEAADVGGQRAVHFAALNGQTSFLNHIVSKYNADFEVQNNDGHTPLHCAAERNNLEIAQYLIEHGTDVNVVNNSQQTALHISAGSGSISIAILLLKSGAQVEAVDVDGNRAVHIAAQNGQTSFLNHIVTRYNADFDVPNNEGMSPLHCAAYAGFVDTVKWLLPKDASWKRKDISGRTPLHWAALNGKIEVCMELIDVGTMQDIMVKDNEGNTAMQLTSDNNLGFRALWISKALQAECKHLQNPIIKGKAQQKGKNWPMVIAMQGEAYTGKSFLAFKLALRLNCTIICLDDILFGSEPTNEIDTFISHTFNIIAQIVKTQISLGRSVIVDYPLSRLSQLQKLVSVVSTENTHNTRLLILECKPENEYAYQLRFEESGSAIYANRWYKPAALWPLPKVRINYTDDDIPNGVSKLVFDTNDHYSPCRLLEVMFDVTSCGYGHITKYDHYWQFIHKDKKELFICPCPDCKRKEISTNIDVHFHEFIFYEREDYVEKLEKLCGACENKVRGSHYTCKDCELILHQSCAELAAGEKKHFVPESFPIFLPSEPHYRYAFPEMVRCAECRKDGNCYSFKCRGCLFESHLKSRLVPTVVRHKVNNKFLTFWLNSNVDGSTNKYVCLACRKHGDFAAYSYGLNQLYHPKCALLPLSVHHSHGGYEHDLEMITSRVEKLEDYMCDCCSIKMDPIAWYYYCSECNISMHLECAFLDFDTGEPITKVCS